MPTRPSTARRTGPRGPATSGSAPPVVATSGSEVVATGGPALLTPAVPPGYGAAPAAVPGEEATAVARHIAEVAAGPAHFFGISHPEQPEGRRLLVQVAGEFPLPLPQVEAGRYLVGGEVPDGLGQRCSFGGHERHGARLRRILGRDVKAAHAGSRV